MFGPETSFSLAEQTSRDAARMAASSLELARRARRAAWETSIVAEKALRTCEEAREFLRRFENVRLATLPVPAPSP